MTDDRPFRSRLRGPVLDCRDAIELAEFYAALLGWEITQRTDPGVPHGWALVESPDKKHKVELQGLADYQRPVWPNTAGEQQQMIHLDIAVDNPAAIDWCVAHGATIADHQPNPNVKVMLDPAGHPFCLFGGNVD